MNVKIQEPHARQDITVLLLEHVLPVYPHAQPAVPQLLALHAEIPLLILSMGNALYRLPDVEMPSYN